MTNHPPRQRDDEVAAALHASRELGPEYDEAVAASLVERIDDTIAERVRHHMAAQGGAAPAKAGMPSNTVRFVLSLVCLGVSIPISGITAALGNPAALPLVWLGLIVFYLVSVVGLRR
ncbi:hypothetical protein [Nocardiopsis quinghaiensis]|uniref:hypothetical protein n=1 Tax=Nocardiopsis quinghaiensis TaxID=464995 RepID=UPI00123B03E3|nr:hypothetical protein [Nocardiopsis quinghaiensis]